VTEKTATDKARARVRSLIVTGDNRLKQGGREQARKARETYEKALTEAEKAGLADDLIRSLLERRIADCRRLELARDDDGEDE
jgi:chorismate mutase